MLKKIYSIALAAVVSLSAVTASAQSLSPSTKWHWDKGTIVVESPERPAGQQLLSRLYALLSLVSVCVVNGQ